MLIDTIQPVCGRGSIRVHVHAVCVAVRVIIVEILHFAGYIYVPSVDRKQCANWRGVGDLFFSSCWVQNFGAWEWMIYVPNLVSLAVSVNQEICQKQTK